MARSLFPILISLSVLSLALHLGKSAREQLRLKPELRMSTDCDAKELQKLSSFVDRGGNAFVIKLTGDVCGGKTDDVLKAFKSQAQRDTAVDILSKLPSQCSLAGLKCSESNKDDCKLNANCVNSKWKDEFPESQECYYMRMVFGGSKTLEKCLEGDNFQSKHLEYLIRAALSQLQCIHGQGFYHRDYQLKNIVTGGSCSSQDLKVIDLDGMQHKNDNTEPSGQQWSAEYHAWRDYAMFFGSCNMGASALETLVPAKNEKVKKLAQAMRLKAEKLLKCGQWSTDTTWKDVIKLGKAVSQSIAKA